MRVVCVLDTHQLDAQPADLIVFPEGVCLKEIKEAELSTAFRQEHKRCGLLDSEVTRRAGEHRVTFECECGAVIWRMVKAAP